MAGEWRWRSADGHQPDGAAQQTAPSSIRYASKSLCRSCLPAHGSSVLAFHKRSARAARFIIEPQASRKKGRNEGRLRCWPKVAKSLQGSEHPWHGYRRNTLNRGICCALSEPG
ncbi:hypothetical protein GGF41_005969 [Coemansia sp. RSA 2531]|nr:hypothetical protein GGF41_005969 [Coemansia sp. RSA 2531]